MTRITDIMRAPALRTVDLPDQQGVVMIKCVADRHYIQRTARRGHVQNVTDMRESAGQSVPLTRADCDEILDQIAAGQPYNDVFVTAGLTAAPDMAITDVERVYTSTGDKFWRHRAQMESYRAGTGQTVISTHISPEGACNLRCPFCSVTYRDTHARIELPVIQQYVTDLLGRGLKAVILTGGGEPTMYPQFSELVLWLKARGLKVALITNGTMTDRVTPAAWACFAWVRVSLNVFDGWETRINLPTESLAADCIVGCSMVYTVEHEALASGQISRPVMLQKAAGVAARLRARYVRVLPNCLLQQDKLLAQHAALDRDLAALGDARFFHQHKVHAAPACGTCHQSYFRPYLSEEPFHGNGQPGTVYPCDSVVLNSAYAHFAKQYQLCHASQVLDYLDRKIVAGFDPRVACAGCVFTKNVALLDDWVTTGDGQFIEQPLEHEEFV